MLRTQLDNLESCRPSDGTSLLARPLRRLTLVLGSPPPRCPKATTSGTFHYSRIIPTNVHISHMGYCS